VRALEHPGARARVIATPESATVAGVDGVEIWRCGEKRVEPGELLQRLGERGADRVLVEGGGETNAAFVAAGLVDEVYVTIAPALLGGSGAPTPVDGDGFGLGEKRRLHLLSVNRVDDELFCHYVVEP
jgi:riboflavin biosynthesis pyrimidine reductase